MAKQTGQSITSRDNPIVAVWGRHRIHHAYRLGWHDEMEINFIKEGSGCYFVEGKNISYGKNSVIVIQPHEIHRLLSSPGSQVEKFCLMFDVKRMAWPKAVLSDVLSLRRHVSLTGGEAAIVEQIIHKIIRENKDRKPGGKRSTAPCCWVDVPHKAGGSQCFRACMHPGFAGHWIISNSIMPLLSTSMTWHHPYMFLTGIYSDCLKGMLGCLKHYVLQRRVLAGTTHDCRQSRHIKLEAVSEAVGFKQYSLFHRAFKKFTGLPPSAYGGIYQV